MPDPIVFISYRRADSQHAVGRLRGRLVPRHFSDPEVFMDVSDIDKGSDFADKLRSELTKCQVVFVVIGRTWASITGADGQRRIDNPRDYVRMEVAAALQRGIPVIPVLVDDAKMPSVDELPEPLKGLATRNAMHIVSERFEADADALAREVKRHIGRPEDAELDLLKLLFSFKGTASRKQFWFGVGMLFLAYLAVRIAMIAALDIALIPGLFEPQNLKGTRDVMILQIAGLWHLWPMLALIWKRLKDIGHGWEFFAPIVGLSALEAGLEITQRFGAARTVALICLVSLIFAGSVQGTRFIADGARD